MESSIDRSWVRPEDPSKIFRETPGPAESSPNTRKKTPDWGGPRHLVVMSSLLLVFAVLGGICLVV